MSMRSLERRPWQDPSWVAALAMGNGIGFQPAAGGSTAVCRPAAPSGLLQSSPNPPTEGSVYADGACALFSYGGDASTPTTFPLYERGGATAKGNNSRNDFDSEAGTIENDHSRVQ